MNIDTVTKIYEMNDDGTSTNNFSNVYKVVYKNGITSFVPHDEENKDFQTLQEWIADGNTVIDNKPE
tara:strand:+ start:498 stop:698 length:201 start_codon:yes stop_codon:yes gene_type:complete